MVTPTQIPGSSNVKNIDRILINFRKFAKIGFKLSSSGDAMKSVKVAGSIKTYGLPFIMIQTLPLNKCLATLSGLSVASIVGIPNLELSPN